MSTQPSATPPPDAGDGAPAASARVRVLERPLSRDLLVGLAIGGLLTVSAFTPNEWLPSLGVGAAAAVVYVGWRTLRRWRHPEAAAGTARAERSGPLLRVPPAVWLALLALALAFGPTALVLYQSWTTTVWNNAHGILIPPAMAYLAWSVLRRDVDSSPQSSAWGFAFLVPGLLLVCLDAVLRTRQIAALGLVLSLPGLSLLLLGRARTSRLRIPFLLALLMVPVPISLAGNVHLKETTAAAVAPLLSALGIPVLQENMYLYLPNATFMVADACSGFGALYAAVGLSLVLAAAARSPWRRILILVAAPCLALLCNVARVALLVGLAHFLGLGLLDTRFHEASGVATFSAVLVLLFLIADRRSLRESFL